MTAGESIKKGAESAKKVTENVVDAVEGKVNEATDAVENALKTAADKVHHAASDDTTHK